MKIIDDLQDSIPYKLGIGILLFMIVITLGYLACSFVLAEWVTFYFMQWNIFGRIALLVAACFCLGLGFISDEA